MFIYNVIYNVPYNVPYNVSSDNVPSDIVPRETTDIVH